MRNFQFPHRRPKDSLTIRLRCCILLKELEKRLRLINHFSFQSSANGTSVPGRCWDTQYTDSSINISSISDVSRAVTTVTKTTGSDEGQLVHATLSRHESQRQSLTFSSHHCLSYVVKPKTRSTIITSWLYPRGILSLSITYFGQIWFLAC